MRSLNRQEEIQVEVGLLHGLGTWVFMSTNRKENKICGDKKNG